MVKNIQFERVAFTYNHGTPFAHQALDDINFEIEAGSFTAIIGQTGSGKSSLLQLINGLNKPTEGQVQVLDYLIQADSSEKDLKDLRRSVGTVFQFPESQLFASSVGEDIAFGPQNFGYGEEEALQMARDILPVVGLATDLFDQSPFDLSGGQQRRVAIAGVLVMEPEILLLDEPTAGLDPKGQDELMALFKDLHAKGTTIVLVTHRMEQVAEFADEVIVMEEGTNIRQAEPRDLFKDKAWLRAHGLDVPQSVDFAFRLEDAGFSFEEIPLDSQELAGAIVRQVKEGSDE